MNFKKSKLEKLILEQIEQFEAEKFKKQLDNEFKPIEIAGIYTLYKAIKEKKFLRFLNVLYYVVELPRLAEGLEVAINKNGADGAIDYVKKEKESFLYLIPRLWVIPFARYIADLFLIEFYDVNLKSILGAGRRVATPPTGLSSGGRKKFSDIVDDEFWANYPFNKLKANGIIFSANYVIVDKIKELNKKGYNLPIDPDEADYLAGKLIKIFDTFYGKKYFEIVKEIITEEVKKINLYSRDTFEKTQKEMELEDVGKVRDYYIQLDEREEAIKLIAYSFTVYLLYAKILKYSTEPKSRYDNFIKQYMDLSVITQPDLLTGEEIGYAYEDLKSVNKPYIKRIKKDIKQRLAFIRKKILKKRGSDPIPVAPTKKLSPAQQRRIEKIVDIGR